MKPGRYASDDGSFARSAGGAGARGLALLAIALLIGIVLLNATDADPPGATVSASGDADTTDADTGDGGDAAGEGDDGGGAETPASVPTTTTVPARAPKDVKVIIANASDVNGAAGNAKKVLDPVGFNVLAPSNAGKVPESSVFHTPGFEADARAVATALGLPATVIKALPAPPPFDTKGANVAVVIGADAGTKFAAAPAAAGTGAPATGTGGTTATTAARSGAGGTTATTAAGSGATASSTTTTAVLATTTTKRP